MSPLQDLYSDYLLASFDQATATGLSRLLDGAVSHDQVTRLLSGELRSSKALWHSVKSLVREHESDTAALIFDDSIIEKPFSDENALNCWHWDHSKNRSVKGINLLSAFYHSSNSTDQLPLRVPVAYELITKPIMYCELKTKKVKRKSEQTKNELMRNMIDQCIRNQLKFQYVLADSWFGSSDNMRHIHKKKKHFIFDMKTNRKAALSEQDRNEGNWTSINQLDIADNTPVKVWLKDLDFPVLLTKQVLTNKDLSTGTRYLVSNNFDLTDDEFTTIYKKRWSVEEYHKSLKQNAAAAKSPARSIRSQSNHLFASILAYVKLEKLKLGKQMNHFALKSKLYLVAIKAAFKELCELKNQFQVTA